MIKIETINETLKTEYQKIFDVICSIGFDKDNKYLYLYAISIIIDMIDKACWYGVEVNPRFYDILTYLSRLTGIRYPEEIRDIYKNINTPQTSLSWRLYRDSIAKANLERVASLPTNAPQWTPNFDDFN